MRGGDRRAVIPSRPVAARELEIIATFTDLAALDPERRDADSDDGDTRAPREYFLSYLRSLDVEREGLPQRFADDLLRALAHFGVTSLDRSDELDAAVFRLFTSQQRRAEQLPIVLALLDDVAEGTDDLPRLRLVLDRLIGRTQRRYPDIASRSRSLRYRRFDRPHIERARAETSAHMRDLLAALAGPAPSGTTIGELVACPLPAAADPRRRGSGRVGVGRVPAAGGVDPAVLQHPRAGRHAPRGGRAAADELRAQGSHRPRARRRGDGVADGGGASTTPWSASPRRVATSSLPTPWSSISTWRPRSARRSGSTSWPTRWSASSCRTSVRRVAVIGSHAADGCAGVHVPAARQRRRPSVLDAVSGDDGAGATVAAADPARFEEDVQFRGLHPMIARRLQMWRLSNFRITRLPSSGDVHVFDCVGRVNESDRRLLAVAEVRDLTPVRDEDGRAVGLPEVESQLVGCLDAIRDARAQHPDLRRLEWNRVMLYLWPLIDLSIDEIREIARRLAPLTEGFGLEQIVISGRFVIDGSEPTETVLRLGYEPGRGLTVRLTPPPEAPMQPLDEYARKVIQTRRRGLVYPYELVPLLARDSGSFVEYDLDDGDRLVPVDRAPGGNKAGVVVGVVSTPTNRYPDGLHEGRRAG